MYKIIALLAVAVALHAQTKLDLQRQSRGIDFTSMTTKPVQSGAALPETCTPGQMFFRLSAGPEPGLFGCNSAGLWVLQSPVIPAHAGEAGKVLSTDGDVLFWAASVPAVTAIRSGGQPVGARSALDIWAGPGLMTAVSDTGTAVSVQHSVDTAVVATRSEMQAGTPLLCASGGGSATAWTCALEPMLHGYSIGMTLNWRPDVSNAGGAATLDVDTLGPVPVKLADGTTDPEAGDIMAGQMYRIWYDGASFRLAAGPRAKQRGTAAARPECSAATRGSLWFTEAEDGARDEFAVCARAETGEFLWSVLN